VLGRVGLGIVDRAIQTLIHYRKGASVLPSPALVISPRDVDAVVFDLDGVLTDTARIHAAVWKTVFDELLRRRAKLGGEAFRPFDLADEYRAYVDGRSRLDGIRAFLAARGILLPEGNAGDPEGAETVHGLARRKNRLVQERLRQESVPEPGAVALLRRLRRAGVRTAVASSSANCAAVLRAAALDDLIDVRVDGIDAAELGLPGKPDPALFLETLRRLAMPPARSVLFEDALAGVEAGQRAGFGRVIAVDRGGQSKALRDRGADVVVSSLVEVAVALN
jgi:beta-phosphoglucomutase family hydrolase